MTAWITRSILFGVALTGGILFAQEVDVRQALESQLSAAGQVAKRRTVPQEYVECVDRCCQRCEVECSRCTKKVRQVEQTYSEQLHVATIAVQQVPVMEYGQAILNNIPEKILLQTFQGTNCGATTQTANSSVSISAATSETLSVTNAVSTGTTINAGVTYTIQSFGSANVGVSVNRTVSLSKSASETHSETITRTDSVNKTMAPMTRLLAEYRVVESSMSVPFKAAILVDGDVDANLNGYKKISDVLRDPAKRTFVAQGMLSVTAASQGVLDYREQKLSAADCASSSGKLTFLQVAGSAVPLSRPNLHADLASLDTQLHTALVAAPLATKSDLSDLDIQIPKDKKSAEVDFLRDKLKLPSTVPLVIKRQGKKGLVVSAPDTPGFSASGDHICWSDTDAGHSCHVWDVGFDDCNQAYFKLKANDCCPSTRICTTDPQTGTQKCTLGGTSIGFTLSSCLPM